MENDPKVSIQLCFKPPWRIKKKINQGTSDDDEVSGPLQVHQWEDPAEISLIVLVCVMLLSQGQSAT